MKRIVEETLEDGTKQYRVETNRLWGFIPIKWTTDLCYVGYPYDIHVSAIFSTLKEAQRHCGIDPNPVKERKIL